MSWRDLIEAPKKETLLWVGGRTIFSDHRTYYIEGRNPPEYGWWLFETNGNMWAKWVSSGEPCTPKLSTQTYPSFEGYMVHNRVVLGYAGFHREDTLQDLLKQTREVHLAPAQPRFTRGLILRLAPECLVYVQEALPLGPEGAVEAAFLDDIDSVDAIPGVTPQLAAVFHIYRLVREEERRKEQEIARQKHLEELRRSTCWSAEGRRLLAQTDLRAAVSAELAVAGALLLDVQEHYGETVVTFRFARRRFACVIDPRTFQILDAGICLSDHSGRRGDRELVLSSLPSVIQEAIDTDALVVLRHT